MTRERQRIHLAPGLSIYREFLMWRFDGIVAGKRIRRTLHTHNVNTAIWLAQQALEEESEAYRALPKPPEPGPDGVVELSPTYDNRRDMVFISGLKP